MRIRCVNCHGAVWVELDEAAGGPVKATCPTCKREYRVDVERDPDTANDFLGAEARQLVLETQIDLPSAYSVLLGVMSLEDVLELGDVSALPCPTTAPAQMPSSAPARAALGYDPEFRPAVEAGHLTPMQAMQRGLRTKYAALVAKRHRLPEDIAISVADDRISLLEALRRRGPDPGPPIAVAVPASRAVRVRVRPGVWVIAVVIVVVCAFLIYRATGSDSRDASGMARLSTVLGAEVLSDEWGRALKVSASDPKAVLAAYCAVDAERRFEPVEIIVSDGNGTSERLGLLRRVGRSGELLSIVVREDRGANRWVAGDGLAPLVPHTAPPAAARAIERH